MKIAVAIRGSQASLIGTPLNSGLLKAYSGTKPADTETSVGAATILAEYTFGATAFGAASGATITANAITGDSSANASGTPSFYRAFQSNGTTVVCDFDPSEVTITPSTITAGTPSNVTACTITVPNGT